MAEFQINGETYLVGKLSAMDAFNLGRRMANVLAFFAKQPDKDRIVDRFPQAFTALSGMIGNISDDDMEFIRRTCYSVVQRKQATGWAKIAPNGVLMFSDLDDLKTMLTIIFHVVSGNGLIDFFAEAPSDSGTGTTAAIG